MPCLEQFRNLGVGGAVEVYLRLRAARVRARVGRSPVEAFPTRLTTQRAANLLGVSRPTLIKMLDDGKIPYEPPRGHCRLRREDVLAYRARQRVERDRTMAEMVRQTEELGLYEDESERGTDPPVPGRERGRRLLNLTLVRLGYPPVVIFKVQRDAVPSASRSANSRPGRFGRFHLCHPAAHRYCRQFSTEPPEARQAAWRTGRSMVSARSASDREMG